MSSQRKSTAWLHLGLEVVRVDGGAQLDLFDLVAVLMLLALLLPLLLLVLVLAEVDEATDGGVALGAISTRSTPGCGREDWLR
jgi:hypothetical protein